MLYHITLTIDSIAAFLPPGFFVDPFTVDFKAHT